MSKGPGTRSGGVAPGLECDDVGSESLPSEEEGRVGNGQRHNLEEEAVAQAEFNRLEWFAQESKGKMALGYTCEDTGMEDRSVLFSR